jgi:hypothetical protein
VLYIDKGLIMCYVRAFWVVCLAALLLSCDENPVTAPATEPQAIVGQVISDEVNVEVAAWQAQLVQSTIADSAGYFVLSNIPVGLYEVRIATPSGETLTLKSITVAVNRTTSLREIRLTDPSWPLIDVYPRDSTFGVRPIDPTIRITSTQPFDLVSLDSSASFTPEIEGSWHQSSSSISPPSYYYYYYVPTAPLEVATHYVWKISSDLMVAGGQAWGDSLETTFWTDSLRLTSFGSSPNSSSGDEVAPRRDFSLYFGFNTLIDADSLNAAVSFTPPLQGIWLKDRYYESGGFLKFFHTGDSGLQAELVYLVHIAGDVPLVGSKPLGEDLDLSFKVAPLQVVYSTPNQGGTLHCRTCDVRLLFNSEMDSVSLRSAFALESEQGDTVSGEMYWYNLEELSFRPDSSLDAGAVYVARLDTTVQNLYGDRLKEPYALYFRTR